MTEGTPIGRTDDPDAVESSRRSSADADHEAVYAAPDESDRDPEDERESVDDDRASGFRRSTGDQDDVDAEEADDITLRLSSDG
jgi:hypothetical protein